MSLFYSNQILQSPISFPINTIKLENAIVDEIVLTTDTTLTDFPNEWHKATKLHAKFQNSIVAGGLAYDINKDNINCGFLIKRRAIKDVLWTSVGYIDNSNFIIDEHLLSGTFIDRTALPNEDYEYMIVSIFNGEELYSSSVNTITHCHTDGIAISEIDKTYYTPLEPKLSGITQNKGTTVVETFNSKYPFVFKNGNTNYISGSANGLFVPLNDKCQFVFSNENHNNAVWKYRKEFREWLCNGKPKVLKYYDGRTMLVSINDTVSDDDGEHSDKNITTFNWTEIGDITSTDNLIENGLMNKY